MSPGWVPKLAEGGAITPEDLLAGARELLPWMSAIRRDLHQHPELGLEEHRTSGRVQTLLREIGVEYTAGLAETGVLGVIRGSREVADGCSARVVALRADLDALPLEDAKDVPYRSLVPGRMHACGHDVHTAVLLGAARLLAERRRRLRGTVKLIFQPAEETVGGARLLVEQGVLDNPRVEAIFGLHVDSNLEVGEIGLRYGQRNASSDDFSITVHGRSGHGAYPASGIDAIVAAAHVITALQSVVSRNVDARQSAVVTIGTIAGGTQANILANRVDMVGTLRSLEQETRDLVLRRIRETAENVAAAFQAVAEVTTAPSYDALVNDDRMIDQVRSNASNLLGPEKVRLAPTANMGVEDFGFYLSHVPGAFYSLGIRNTAAGIIAPVHNERFDIDEEAMVYGAALQALNAVSVLEG